MYFDIVIVGAGIAGSSLAWNLLNAKASALSGMAKPRVLMLEKESAPGYHSTGRSAAMFLESYGPPQARALTRASRYFYEHPPEGFCSSPILSSRGCLYVAWQGQGEALEALFAELSQTTTVKKLDAQQTLAIVPVLKSQGLIGAVSEPLAADIDVDVLHQGYLRGFRSAGGELWTKAGLRSAQYDGKQWSVALDDGRAVQCAIIVNAAGAWADAAAQACGLAALGIQPKRRNAFIFDSPYVSKLWPTVGSVNVDWYFKPDAGLLLGSPANADPVEAHDVQAEELDIASAIFNIEQHTSLTIRRPKRVWAGLRSFAADEELVIGPADECAAFYWLAGQGGYGIQSAQGAALLASALIERQPLHAELIRCGVVASEMSPARFSNTRA
jgi:D-arginine dehydrogenase